MKSKSCELDPLLTKFLKSHIDTFIKLLTRLVNMSLTTGTFPDEWKLAILRPLIKGTLAGRELIPTLYRPVSNLPFQARLTEKAAVNQLMNHCTVNNLTLDHQSAYRPNHSCETSLLRIVNDALWTMETGNITAFLSCDLSAAFDSVNHQILLKVLENTFGIKDRALEWFRSYLKDRRSKVCVRNSYSEEQTFNFSIPQGGSGSPWIFNCYCSTIQTVIPTSISLNAFADDHNISQSFSLTDESGEETALHNLEHCLMDIITWMHENRLKINPTKTELIYLGSRKQLTKCKHHTITVGSDTVDRTDQIRLLGLWIDQNLTFNHHVTLKCRTAMWNIFKLKNLRNILDLQMCQILIQSLVFSHLDYSNSVLFGLPNYIIDKMQRVQHVAAKVTLKFGQYESPRLAMFRLHWLPIRARIKFKIALLVHKCIKEEAPIYLRNLLKLKIHTGISKSLRLNDGQISELTIPFMKQNICRMFICNIWS